MSDLRKKLSPSGRRLQQLHVQPARRGQLVGDRKRSSTEDDRTHPLSVAQTQLWFLEQYGACGAAYNLFQSYRVEGVLDMRALDRALQELVRRHETLRTTFLPTAGDPVQLVQREARIDLHVVNLDNLGHAEREERINELVSDETSRPFDLRRGPLFRAQLLRSSEKSHILTLNMHHIVSDGWSIGILLQEMGTLYEAYRKDLPSPLMPLPVRYADFAQWQQEWLRTPASERHLDYWREHLAGLTTLQLPTDRVRPSDQTFAGGVHSRALAPELGEALRTLSRREDATLYTTLLAAFVVLLCRYSGQDDIVVGSAISNRDRQEIAGLVGLFVNVLPLRIDTSHDPRFRDLVSRVRSVLQAAKARQDLPFKKLVDELQPERDTSRNPMLQVAFTQQPAPVAPLVLETITLRPINAIPMDPGTARFDLDVHIPRNPAGLETWFIYNTDLFESETVRRMQGHYERLLEGVVADPERRLSQLPMLSEEERRQAIAGWNPSVRYAMEGCLHERFEAQVARTPEAVAVVCDGEKLSYAELNRRANRLAHRLRVLGVVPDRLVGLRLERGVGMVVGILGILKSGGAYLPLDPAYPQERVAFMLEDSGVPVVVTEKGLTAELEDLAVTRVLLEDTLSGCATNPAPVSTADDLAYVIYTSGSTGTPKGVLITHANVMRLFEATEARFRFDQRDVWTLFHSCAFDFSVWELWGALLYGGRLVVVPYLVSRSPEAFRALLVSEGVTVLNQTPSAFGQLMQADQSQTQADLALRYVIFGGEALDLQSLRPWLERYGDERPRLINMYGITETTVHVTYRPIRRADLDAGRGSVIGLPLADLQVYILDPHGEPTPIGVPGEMYVGGAGVARGYLNRPELTAERFVPDPFRGQPGARLYRSGDRARWLENGELEFLGRLDDQVKLRGHRIELGEVEAALSRHRAVRAAVALVREEAPGDQRLVGYVVAEEGDDESVGALTGQLRRDLRETLPGYMVPSALVMLPELPLTANGKVDRRALPAPESSAMQRAAYVAPRTETEGRIAEIWREVLKLERVGVEDNFFELGGHSLLAVSVIAKMRRAGLHAEVRALFSGATIAALAAAASQESGMVEVPPNRIPPGCEAITPEMLPLVELEPEEIERVVSAVPGGAANVQDIYPLAPLQEGILFHHRTAREADPYLVHFLFSFDRRADVERYVEALRAVIGRQDILRTAVLWEGLPEPVQVVWRRAPLEVEEVSLDADGGDAAQQLDARFGSRHFRQDVSEAPLLRVFIAHDEPNRRWVTLQLVHHLAIDHATVEMMREEIQTHLLGRAGHLPAPMPFRNFVAQSRLGVPREEHEAFFKKMLGDVDEPTTPFGLTDVHGDGSGIAEAYRPADAELARRLRERARALGVSAASVCHLAWAQVLAKVAGREDVVFGTVLFGRTQGEEETDRALGPCINTLPVRLRVGEEGVEESVRQTHTMLAELLRHAHAPLALAQRCSAVAAPAPLFSGLLNYRHSAAAGQVPVREAETRAGVQLLRIEERTNYPVVLSVDDLGEGIGLTAQVQSPIDPARVCTYMHQALEELVGALADDPSTPLRSLDVLPSAERRQVLVEWNDTAVAYPCEASIASLFEEQVERTPDAVAVVYGDASLTYRELDTRTNRLAQHLRGLGVGPEVLVGLCLERSLEMVVGVLGILKAGGAYVPLDPEYPAQRLAFMLEDCVASVLLVQSWLEERLPAYGGAVVRLDTDWGAIEDQPSGRVETGGNGSSLAYVMYTSGSTGLPKGVCVAQRSVVRLVKSTNYLEFGPEEVFLQFAPMSFDASTLELWGALLNGAKLVVHPAGPASLEDLGQAIRDHGVTVLWLTGSLFHQMVDRDLAALHGVRQLLAGGEALSTGHVRRLLAGLGEGQRLVNGYGPTESTTFACCHVMLRGSEMGATVPIGRPIANTRVYVLDERLAPVPVGVPGELYIGGDGLARGYLNQPELTAEKFVADPFDAGKRLYRTGDRARYGSDGAIEFLGRLDDQVKLRGYRIELGEIESVLGAHGGVRKAAVVCREDVPGDKRLAAYVVGATGAELSASELRAHLRERLPSYMVPSAFMIIDALPLTPNGKMDREALPAPEGECQVEEAYVAPRGALEVRLAEIWREVLGVEQVGVHDNFFEIGGNSLLALKLHDGLATKLDTQGSVTDLFRFPTIHLFAQQLASHSRGPDVARRGRDRARRQRRKLGRHRTAHEEGRS